MEEMRREAIIGHLHFAMIRSAVARVPRQHRARWTFLIQVPAEKGGRRSLRWIDGELDARGAGVDRQNARRARHAVQRSASLRQCKRVTSNSVTYGTSLRMISRAGVRGRMPPTRESFGAGDMPSAFPACRADPSWHRRFASCPLGGAFPYEDDRRESEIHWTRI